jgi:hypothetical protein
VAAGLDGGEDLARECPAELGVAELVDELPPAALAMAVPAWTSRCSPGSTGATSRTSTSARPPNSSAQTARPLASSTLTTSRSTATSPHVMQPSKSAMQAGSASLIRSRCP